MKQILFFIIFILISCNFAFAFVDNDFSQEGYASWYGGKFQGRLTASGEVFDTYKYTAAHKTLPFGTILKVTNLDNEKTTVVRINDRGPFIKGRIIDLSRVAAKDIGMLKTGIAYVRIEIYKKGNTEKQEKDKNQNVKANIYKIQVGAFSVEEYAEALKQKLEENGFKVIFEKTDSGIIRVIIINITEKDLIKTKEKLRNMGFSDFVVKKQRNSI